MINKEWLKNARSIRIYKDRISIYKTKKDKESRQEISWSDIYQHDAKCFSGWQENIQSIYISCSYNPGLIRILPKLKGFDVYKNNASEHMKQYNLNHRTVTLFFEIAKNVLLHFSEDELYRNGDKVCSCNFEVQYKDELKSYELDLTYDQIKERNQYSSDCHCHDQVVLN